MPHLERKSDRSWRKTIESNVAEWWKTLEGQAKQSTDPINPQRVFCELSSRLPDRCLITGDSGSSANWFGRDLGRRRGMVASLSGSLAPMPSRPTFAHPNRPVLALVGDVALQMSG